MLRSPPSTSASCLRSSYPCIGDWCNRPRMANSSIPPPHLPRDRCIGTIHRQHVTVSTPVRGDRASLPGDVGERKGPGRLVGAYIGRVAGRRSVVDYSLQRRALLADVYAGRTGLFEVCDASPYLSRAARYHGEATDEACPDRKSTRLNSSHANISYAVFCLKKKKN